MQKSYPLSLYWQRLLKNPFLFCKNMLLSAICLHPPVKYLTEMPLVFASTKININMTIPNIENGAPLRIFDIISAGGFVLTDYRSETCELFIPDKEIAVYDGIEDMAAKAAYYLKHDAERELHGVGGKEVGGVIKS